MKRKFKKSLLIFFVLLFLLEAGVVFALEVKYPSMPGAKPPQVFLEKIEKGEIPKEKALPLFIKYFLSLALIISVSACLLILILGGFSYLISTGNPTVMAEAIKRMSQAGIGLIVILSSYLILTAINPELSILRLPGLEKTPPSHVAEPISEEPRRRCPSIEKAERLLSYKPKVDLTSGLEKTIDWFKRRLR